MKCPLKFILKIIQIEKPKDFKRKSKLEQNITKEHNLTQRTTIDSIPKF